MKLIFCTLLLVGAASACEVCKLFLFSPLKSKYYSFFPLTQDWMEFSIRSAEEAHIILSNSECYEENSYYEFVIGSCDNTVTILRKDGKEVARYKGPVLSRKTFRQFKLNINRYDGTLVLTANTNTILINYKDPYFVPMSKVGMAAYNNVPAEFHFPCNQFRCYNCY